MPDGDLTLSEAALQLGISRDTVRARLRRFGIVPRAVGTAKVLDPGQFDRLREATEAARHRFLTGMPD